MPDDRLIAGVELGGTKSIALLARGREVLEMIRIPTEAPSVTLATLGDQLAQWRPLHGRPEALGIGSFGPLHLARGRPGYGRISATPKAGWSDCDIVGAFSGDHDGPIAFDTDVAGAALAETLWGAAHGCRVVVYLTVGTGVGGGLVVDGRPVHGLIHPEIGHLRVRRREGDGFAGVCPFHGDCLEGLVSGPALAARTGLAGEAVPDGHPVWADVAAELAELVATLMATVSPERILIGGGVVESRPELLTAIRDGAAGRLNGYPAGTTRQALDRVVRAPALGGMAGPLGAVALGRALVSEERPAPAFI